MVSGSIKELSKYISTNEQMEIMLIVQSFDETTEIGSWFTIPRTDLRGLFLNRSNYKEEVFESHRIYQDIHLIIKGYDTILIGSDNDAIPELDYQLEGDYELFSSRILSELKLNEGTFAIINPGELHANRIENVQTLKLVVKRKI